jgi:hypothetical protein
VLHQAANEVDVTGEPIQLSDDDRRALGLLGGCQGRFELRPLGVVILAGLDLGEGLGDLEALGLGEAVIAASCASSRDRCGPGAASKPGCMRPLAS